MPKKEEDIQLTDELKDSLKDIVSSCEKEDDEIRKSMIRYWKKAEEFWDGCQYLFWDSINETWHSADSMSDDDNADQDQVGSFNDKVIDIYKAHGESIISALASQIPALRFLPDDADSTEDTVTARTYSKIADIIQRHNKAKLVFLKALFYLANHGIVASYRYKESDFAYGSHKIPSFDTQKVESLTYTCPNCDYQSEEDWSGQACPQCGEMENPKKQKDIKEVPIQTGVEDKPKTRVKLDIFGALHFKVSVYARNQKECTYLGLFMDQGKDVVCDLYPDNYDEIEAEQLGNTDRFSRASHIYPSEQDVEIKNLVTVGRWWLRPAAFNRETEKSKREKLKKKFPKGCKVTLIGKSKIFAAVEEDELDKRWEIGQAGLSTYIYSGAILRPLIQIQEMRNTLVNLIEETIRHGIPSEFADPKVVNFDTYSRFECLPGYIYQTKPGRPGEPIGNSFYTSNRATLSREVSMFLKQLDNDAQFSVGDYPALYGGPSEGKSRTFAEYAASNQQSKSRHSITWNFIVDWWVRTIAGCVDIFVDTIIEDEKFAQFQDGNFINVWIKRSKMQGKIGGVEPEGSETFPSSQSQIADRIMKLMEMNNEYVNTALYKPENARLIQESLAMTDFKLPGESQRIKQIIEINEIIKNNVQKISDGPILTGDIGPDGQEILQSSVPTDPNVDDEAVHVETIISWAVDLIGMECARENPAAYADVMAHLQMHQRSLMMKTMQASGATAPGEQPETAHAGVE